MSHRDRTGESPQKSVILSHYRTSSSISIIINISSVTDRHSIHGMMEEENVVRPHQEIAALSLEEKKYLLAVERGDVASTRRILEKAEAEGHININCVDPLGRSALLMAIDNENLEMVELLINHRMDTKDALLHAISEEFVEAVEVLLDHEDSSHKNGDPHSWEALPPDTATFTPDITPLILAAHRDNYEIIKILLDRGATLPMPHDRHSIHGMMEEENVVRPHQEIAALSLEEKKYLLAVERGDVASTRRILEKAEAEGHININCVDPLGRSALLMAIDNENLEMVELLINHRMDTKDALLHAISEEFVEAVEVLLDHEDSSHKNGDPHSWEALPPDTATFTPDITPLILAAHRDNYEIIKILLDRGATLPMPHDVRCGCDDCVTSRQEDSLRHSRSRINAYRALASPSLVALSSKDPILTAFELSWELRRLSFLEHEFKNEYQELRRQCQDFATALLDHTRSSHELEVLLNHDPTGPAFEHGDRMHLNRLKLAVKLRQKKVI
ncbi:TRPgamma cation channel [Culex quinquefasciatus]|uniref:TRPgamma cation channel n=1 Tax=Culex quinquefasciatus TaxID=7176 RepID=B0W540_CULQU|nr:TRPgamma cation channel [Culex quinquefasciatus]|eukprot:XP_001843824.1 TRPgamma cation channel [Culex quinquefasciatus]